MFAARYDQVFYIPVARTAAPDWNDPAITDLEFSEYARQPRLSPIWVVLGLLLFWGCVGALVFA